MCTRKRAHLIALGITLAASTLSQAGVRDGGGGAGVECTKPDGTSTLVTLDYYEASRNHQTFPVEANSKDDVSDFVAQRMFDHAEKPLYAFPEVQKEINETDSKCENARISAYFAATSVPGLFGNLNQKCALTYGLNFKSEPLNLTNDYGPISLAPECKIKQIAVFHESGEAANTNKGDPIEMIGGHLDIDFSLWNRLDWLNKGIIFAHEETYNRDREIQGFAPGDRGFGADTKSQALSFFKLMKGHENIGSKDDRRYVVDLLSTGGIPKKDDTVPQNTELYKTCGYKGGSENLDETTIVYAFDYNSRLRLVIHSVGLRTSPYQMTADFAGVTLAKLYNLAASFDVTSEINLSGYGPSGVYLHLMKPNPTSPIRIELLDQWKSLITILPFSPSNP